MLACDSQAAPLNKEQHCPPEVTVTHLSHMPSFAQHTATSVPPADNSNGRFFCDSRVTEKGLLEVPVSMSWNPGLESS